MARKKADDPAKAAKSEMNMTPMIDVTFQLIIVFLCSMKFRTLDQKLEAFLPKDVGLSTAPATADIQTTVSVKLRRRASEATTSLYVLESRLGNTELDGIWGLLENRLKEFRAKDEKIKAEIDADADVPHGDVIRALDCFRAAELVNVVFRGTQLNKTGTFQQAPRR
jgi:biopolymer transport protein ExbD